MPDTFHHCRLQAYDLRTHLIQQINFSLRTFGPNDRTEGVLKHIEKEIAEVRKDPSDLSEWIDLIILACDGAWRCAMMQNPPDQPCLPGRLADEVIATLTAKMRKNEKRVWPDWREASPDEAIEHVRGTHD